jgi:hypothetical protein
VTSTPGPIASRSGAELRATTTHDAAVGTAGFDQFERVGEARQRQWRHDPGSKHTTPPEFHQAFMRPRHFRGLAVAVVAPLQAGCRDVLDQKIVGLDLGNAASGEPQRDDASVPRPCAHRRIEYVCTERVDDHVNSPAAGRLVHLVAQCLAQVRLSQVDRVPRPVAEEMFRAFVRVDAGQHGGSQGDGDLHRCLSHCARGPVHQDDVSGAATSTLDQREPCGLRGQSAQHRIDEGHAVGQRHALGFGCDQFGGEGARFDMRQHAITRPEARNSCADAAHDASRFLAGREGHGRVP